jgi:hypothetical protein
VASAQAQLPAENGLDEIATQILGSTSLLVDNVQRSVGGLTPIGAIDGAWVTHYGESFNGQALGCSANPYASDDASIVAVGPSLGAQWPCGTVLQICGPGGCIMAEREDGCPGCGDYHIDLSEEGLLLVCGPGSGVCQASVEAFTPPCAIPPGRGAADDGGPLELFATLAEAALSDRTADILNLTQDASHGQACTVHAPLAP